MVTALTLVLLHVQTLSAWGQAAGANQFGAARPVECGAQDGGRVANRWERAKIPELREYCELLARGTARLVGTGTLPLASEVIATADAADKLLPGRAAPGVLKGRAYLKLGKPVEARAALLEAKSRDERALDDPVALLAWARANARTGHDADAVLAYRAALPRTSALSSQERSAAAFEAGMIVMGQGPKGVDDAVAMLRQARRDAQDAMQMATVVALALALDRSGQRDEARAVIAERVRSDPRPVLSDPKIAESLADCGLPSEKDAIVAMALEGIDASAARDGWRRYLENGGGKGPWADHARQHEGPGKPAPRKVPPR